MDEPDERKLVKTVIEYFRYPAWTKDGRVVNGQMPWRYYRKSSDFPATVKGGTTHCRLVFDDGSQKEGWAYCSKKDNFNYRLGRKIAIGRAFASDFMEDDSSGDL